MLSTTFELRGQHKKYGKTFNGGLVGQLLLPFQLPLAIEVATRRDQDDAEHGDDELAKCARQRGNAAHPTRPTTPHRHRHRDVTPPQDSHRLLTYTWTATLMNGAPNTQARTMPMQQMHAMHLMNRPSPQNMAPNANGFQLCRQPSTTTTRIISGSTKDQTTRVHMRRRHVQT